MKKDIRHSMLIKKIVPITVGAAFLFLGACASTKTPPPPGLAIIDVKPDPDFRKGIRGITLVSINEEKARGTRKVIKPGLNTIKTQFKWPHGQAQQVDLRFYASPGSAYTIHYDVFPPASDRKTPLTDGLVSGNGGQVILLFPLVAVTGVGEGIAHNVGNSRVIATYIDLVVFGPNSEGAVRQVRAYPDGRVERKPWNSWAQMKAP